MIPFRRCPSPLEHLSDLSKESVVDVILGTDKLGPKDALQITHESTTPSRSCAAVDLWAGSRPPPSPACRRQPPLPLVIVPIINSSRYPQRKITTTSLPDLFLYY
ncbi:hypothetical protein SEVIR_4G133250v4 [Setaria viridis]